MISALLLEASHCFRSALALTAWCWWLAATRGLTSAIEVLHTDAFFMSNDFIKSPLGADLPSFFQISSYFDYPGFKDTRPFLCSILALCLEQGLCSSVALRDEI